MKYLPLLFATTMLLVITVFPKPGDLSDSLSFLKTPDMAMQANVPSERGAEMLEIVERSQQGEYSLTDFETSGCAQAIEQADDRTLILCSEVISSVVRQVIKFERTHEGENTMAERLLLAATQICRAAWSDGRGMAIDRDNPACATSTLLLAQIEKTATLN